MLLVALLLTAAPPQYPATLTQPLLGRAQQFRWPKPAAFEQRWSTEQGAPQGFDLVEATVTRSSSTVSSGYYWVRPFDRGWVVASVATRADDPYRRDERWRTASIDGDEWSLGDAGGVLHVKRWLRGPLAGEEATAWVYTSTLLTADGPLYADTVDHAAAVASLVDRLARDPKQLAAWARAEAKNDALYEQLRAYQPMGSCSMDTRPQDAARVFGELAYARGDLGRFLQLQLRIMGDRFDRVARSSYGEAAHATESARLASTGIDVETFLLGSLMAAPGRDDGLGAWRFARAVGELGNAAHVLPKLQRVVTAPSGNAFNRLSATKAWVWISAGAGKGGRGGLSGDEAPALRAALKLDLHPAAKFWAEAELDALRAKP